LRAADIDTGFATKQNARCNPHNQGEPRPYSGLECDVDVYCDYWAIRRMKNEYAMGRFGIDFGGVIVRNRKLV
jgi:hypothetical protein